MTPLLRELQQVCPPIDANGLSIEWTIDLARVTPLLLDVLGRFPAGMSQSWRRASPPDVTSDLVRLRHVLEESVFPFPDHVFMIRREPDGIVHAIGALVRWGHMDARWNIYIGGIPRGATLRKAFWDIGIRRLAATVRAIPPATAAKLEATGYRIVGLREWGDVDILVEMDERPTDEELNRGLDQLRTRGPA
jgi:hypothetical protein